MRDSSLHCRTEGVVYYNHGRMEGGGPYREADVGATDHHQLGGDSSLLIVVMVVELDVEQELRLIQRHPTATD